MSKKQTVTYYAYADENNKLWYLHNSPAVSVQHRYLLFELICINTDEKVTTDDVIPEVGGVYKTAENIKVKVLERYWYGITYQPSK